ncbi:DUF2384 domain-containing protein [Ferrimonas sediminicola]|uniref:DUF2384 domain-containing protein n=1 Tax=Ferrimonas sediminicola TaxID=2569538 RepID=A0A4U1B7M4_9GAMM|nr:antitoxin Xre/MbcA/ParS toxin-binding domain-containing protein [Ferrimonas sediminicola]TKB46489.1 DUF2384 domain-containing protein [Ferrimonas sediminicola]
MADTSLTLDEIVISRLESGKKSELSSALGEAMLQELRLKGCTLKCVANTLPRQIVARAIGVNNSNLHKLYRRKRLSRVQSERISDLTAFWAEMNGIFMHDDLVLDEWLNSKLPALGGLSPMQMMETLPGRKALREILNRLQYGDFS